MFGTDFPIEHYESTIDPIPDLKLPADVQYALDRGNAERLFPPVQGVSTRTGLGAGAAD
jgi:hypothetical protein